MDLDRLRRRLSIEEGRYAKVYFDTERIPTIGVGFNLQRDDARERIEAVGADYEAVLAGTAELTEDQVDGLLDWDIGVAVRDAHRVVHDFDSLPENAQQVVVDMCFNMGLSRVLSFHNMLAAIDEEEWPVAAMELQNSKWFRQVGNRGPALVSMLATAGGI